MNNPVPGKKEKLEGYGEVLQNPVKLGATALLDTLSAEDERTVLSDMAFKVGRYVAGVLDPEYANRLGIQIKQPNLIPIPSVTISQRCSYTITPALSKFWLSWNPSFFVDQKGLERILIANNYQDANGVIQANAACSLIWGTDPDLGATVSVIKDSIPTVGIAKSRLVSAKMRVTYRGSTDKQSGKFIGCATYQPLPILVGTIPTNEENPIPLDYEGNAWTIRKLVAKAQNCEPDVVKSSPLMPATVLNGIWSKTVGISENTKSIVCTYIPTDPSEQIFCDPGTYRGFGLAGGANTPTPDNMLMSLNSTYGGGLGFIVLGDGLDNAQNVDVEVFYNWEVIPDITSASSMRNYNTDYNPTPAEYGQLMKNYMDGEASVKAETTYEASKSQNPTLGGWSDILQKARAVGTTVRDVLNALV